MGWRKLSAIVIAYALALQALLVPVQRVQAFELAKIEAELGILCTGDGTHQLPDGSGSRDCRDMQCCLPSLRTSQVDVAILPAVIAVLAPADQIAPATIAWVRPQSRAPPPVATAPLQPRAPPAILV